MILLFLILMSLSAIYFSRLLSIKKMRVAAAFVATLYSYLVAWIYLIFIIDIADLGFAESETQLTLLHGSNIYHSFVQLTAKMSAISLPMLQAIVSASIAVLIASLFVVFHGLFEISKEIMHFIRKCNYKHHKTTEISVVPFRMHSKRVSLLRLYCRANC